MGMLLQVGSMAKRSIMALQTHIFSYMDKYTHKVSLRIWHPKLTAEEISDELQLEPCLTQTVGQKMKTPKGDLLENICSETFWLHKFIASSPILNLEDFLNEITNLLSYKSNFLNLVTSTGGRSELFCGIFLNTNMGVDLDNQLMKKITDLSLSVGLDIYIPE